MNSEQDTPIQTNLIIEAINNALGNFRQEMKQGITDLRHDMNERFNNLEVRLRRVEDELGEIKNLHMSFDVRIDRLQANSHKLLNVAINARADVKVLRAEVSSWAADVAVLQQKAA